MSLDCVVDASVGVKLFLLELLSEKADALFSHLGEEPPVQFYVPDFFFVECANILWKYVQRHGYPAQNAQEDVANLLRLPLRAASTRELVSEALALAIAHKITTYDATYAALSQQLFLPLVTADESLVRRLEGSSIDVCWLGEWPRCITHNDADSEIANAPR